MSALFTETGEARYPNGKRAYECDHCGLVSPWTETWVYYGTVEGEANCPTYCCIEHGLEHRRTQREVKRKQRQERRASR